MCTLLDRRYHDSVIPSCNCHGLFKQLAGFFLIASIFFFFLATFQYDVMAKMRLRDCNKPSIILCLATKSAGKDDVVVYVAVVNVF